MLGRSVELRRGKDLGRRALAAEIGASFTYLPVPDREREPGLRPRPTAGMRVWGWNCMANIERALQIAAKAHEGQKDKGGLPYILHPLRVMMRVEGEEAQIVAVLHDVVEDTPVTADDLRQAGFSERVLAAVLCVTHRKDEPYADYVVRCKGNEVARRV